MAKKSNDIQPASASSQEKALQLAVTNRDLESIRIESLIMVFREQQIMLDRDLAMLYGVETKALNQAVKRNLKRFPERFRFQLSEQEKNELVTNCDRFKSLKHSNVAPYAFTEQGISMLSTVLHSQTAIEMSIKIMDAFVAMRHFLIQNAQVFQRLANIEYHQVETDKKIDEVFKLLDASIPPKQGIFYDGQVFDAYQFVSDLVRKAKKSIVLIDNYVDDTVLTLLDKRDGGVTATIYTQRISQQLQLDITRHNSQYDIINVEHFNRAHDRFMLIDDGVYHIGASIKDLGKKWFAFTLMQDITTAEILNKIQGTNSGNP
jgi:hypothetical protein